MTESASDDSAASGADKRRNKRHNQIHEGLLEPESARAEAAARAIPATACLRESEI